MVTNPLVSVIVIFLNAEPFLQEAIDSILAQTYPHWELLLVDDGSTDGSTAIARQLAAHHPVQVRYLEHANHSNCGKGASRNLGIHNARGHYIAFLDADDVWLPNKLQEQVAILDSFPEAGMLYGRTRYWYSWTGNPADRDRDFIPAAGVPIGTVIPPPALLPLFLRGKAAVPCTCSLLLRRSVATAVGGFDESFTGAANIYEDQAFYAKVALTTSIVAASDCWDLYRQHPEASMSVARKSGQEVQARGYFLCWLIRYMSEEGRGNIAVWQALQREQWRIRSPAWLPPSTRAQYGLRWVKKWLLRFEERLLPPVVSRRLWGGTG